NLLECSGLARYEIRAWIEQSDIGEPWKGIDLPCPRICGDCGGKELGFRWAEAVERKHPPCCGEFGSPYNVELQDRWIVDAGVEPLHIKLVSLRCVVRRALQLNANIRIELHEAFELLRDECSFSAEGGAGESEDSFAFVRCAGAPKRCCTGEEEEIATPHEGFQHATNSLSLKGKAESREDELHGQVSHVPQLHVGARPVPNRLQRTPSDLIAPELVVLQARCFGRQVGPHQCTLHLVDVRDHALTWRFDFSGAIRRAVDLIGESEQDQIDFASPDDSRRVVRVPAERLPYTGWGIRVVCDKRAEAVD